MRRGSVEGRVYWAFEFVDAAATAGSEVVFLTFLYRAGEVGGGRLSVFLAQLIFPPLSTQTHQGIETRACNVYI